MRVGLGLMLAKDKSIVSMQCDTSAINLEIISDVHGYAFAHFLLGGPRNVAPHT